MRASSTLRANGPYDVISASDSVGSRGSIDVADGTRPGVGLIVVTPHHCAGVRNEPPTSPPRPSADIPVATATASPPPDPPGLRPGSHRLRVGPWRSLSVWSRRLKSGAFVRPTTTAPAASWPSASGPVTGGTTAAREGFPIV